MKILSFAIAALTLFAGTAQAQTSLCRAEAEGANWRTRFDLVVRDGKPQSSSQTVSGAGAAKAIELTAFGAGSGAKQGWFRIAVAQDSRGQRPAIILNAPAMEADEMVASYRLKLIVGGTAMAEVAASDESFEAGWPTGTSRIYSATIADSATLGPILRALDTAESLTVETVGVLLDKSASTVARYVVPATVMRDARAAGGGVKVQVDQAFKTQTCRSLG